MFIISYYWLVVVVLLLWLLLAPSLITIVYLSITGYFCLPSNTDSGHLVWLWLDVHPPVEPGAMIGYAPTVEPGISQGLAMIGYATSRTFTSLRGIWGKKLNEWTLRTFALSWSPTRPVPGRGIQWQSVAHWQSAKGSSRKGSLRLPKNCSQNSMSFFDNPYPWQGNHWELLNVIEINARQSTCVASKGAMINQGVQDKTWLWVITPYPSFPHHEP